MNYVYTAEVLIGLVLVCALLGVFALLGRGW